MGNPVDPGGRCSLWADCAWRRPVGGAAFELAYSGPRMQTVTLALLPGAAFEEYRLVEAEPALFRSFAALPDSPEAYLAFANTWGSLEEEHGLPYWREWRSWLAWAVGVADASRARDGEALAHVVKWEGEEWSLVEGIPPVPIRPSPWGLDALRPFNPGRICPAGDSATFALVYLLSAVKPLLTFQACWNPHPAPGGPGSLELRCDDLLTGLVGQFYVALLRAQEHRCCLACGKWFEVAQGKGRPDKQVCSPSCRVRLSRMRKKDMA